MKVELVKVKFTRRTVDLPACPKCHKSHFVSWHWQQAPYNCRVNGGAVEVPENAKPLERLDAGDLVDFVSCRDCGEVLAR